MIIGVSGKLGSGKDTVGKIIQYLINQHETNNKGFGGMSCIEFLEQYKFEPLTASYNIKKFADKLKDIVCLLINCTREQLEDQDFKNIKLGEEWDKFYIANKKFPTIPLNGYFNTELEAVVNKQSNPYFNKEGVARLNLEVNRVSMTPRLLLQLIGTNCGRDIIHPNIWVNSLMDEYIPNLYWMCDRCDRECIEYLIQIPSRFKDQGYEDDEFVCPYCKGEESEGDITQVLNDNSSKWIITDMRFPNELSAVKVKGGITIRVIRETQADRFAKIDTDEFHKVVEHESETALDSAEFDYVIENNGTIEELIEKVREILIKENLL